jgi:enoyl-CoA hydratase/carnithine racemase
MEDLPRELSLEREGGIAIITIHREAKRNALHGPLWTGLKRVAEFLASDAPRVVILTGGGGHFCAGMDLSFENPLVQRLAPYLQDKNEIQLTMLIAELKAVPAALTKIPCPVIAAIEGACAGGGLELALACDLRVGAAESFYSLPETRVGMMPDVGGTVRSARLLGKTRAAELVLTGRRVAVEEALSWGLINRTCPKGQAVATAKALAAEIMENGPQATAAALSVLRSNTSEDDAFERETGAGVRALVSGECFEGLQAFMDKRKPSW